MKFRRIITAQHVSCCTAVKLGMLDRFRLLDRLGLACCEEAHLYLPQLHID